MKRYWKWIAEGIVVSVAGVLACGAWWLESSRHAEHWEPSIEAFEAADRSEPPAPGQVLFVGSSSIVSWKSLASDMAPLPVLNRGFGGSHIDHVNHYADRIIRPYAPRAVVLYAGDNDLAAGTGKTPASVFEDFKRFVEIVRSDRAELPVYFIAIKPSRARWNRWPQMREANQLIADYTRHSDGVHYLDIATPMLSEGGGEPDSSLFIIDGLHMTDEGYALWTGIVRPVLMRDPEVSGR